MRRAAIGLAAAILVCAVACATTQPPGTPGTTPTSAATSPAALPAGHVAVARFWIATVAAARAAERATLVRGRTGRIATTRRHDGLAAQHGLGNDSAQDDRP